MTREQALYELARGDQDDLKVAIRLSKAVGSPATPTRLLGVWLTQDGSWIRYPDDEGVMREWMVSAFLSDFLGTRLVPRGGWRPEGPVGDWEVAHLTRWGDALDLRKSEVADVLGIEL
jgi:hypothetical protein